MKIIKSILLYFTRLCLMLIDNAKIDGTQIPTNIPPSLSPLNQRNTENKNERKANTIG